MRQKIFYSSLLFIIIALCLGTLFGCATECEHHDVSQKSVEPTCDALGGILNKCNDCSAEFFTDTLLPLGHHFDTVEVLPDCETQGYDINTCSVCGIAYKSNFTEPLGHTLSVEQTLPTCDKEGYKTASCSACDYSYTFDKIAPTGHTEQAVVTQPTCNGEGYTTVSCMACDYEYIKDITEPLGHTFSETHTHVSAKQQVGSTLYTCACGFSYVGDHRFYSDIFKGAFVDNTQILCKGVDTSKHNHLTDENGAYLPLDWVKIKASGYDFAILRAGYINVIDPVFEMDYLSAREAGLQLGVYFYSYADTVEEARAEAEYLLSIIKGKQFEYPVFFDIEDSRLETLDKQTLTDICLEFISVLQENGYYAGLYTNNRWLTTLLQTEEVTALFDIWYARYPSLSGVVTEATWNEEKYGQQMALWQFSKTGVIEGITAANGDAIYFDLNYAYKDYPTIIKELGYNGF